MSDSRPLYDALGVDPTCSQDDLKTAWRALARELHPDRNPNDPVAAARFRSVRAAWEILGDATRRAMYDEFGEDATSAFFDPEAARAHRDAQPTGRTWSEDARHDTVKRYKATRGLDYTATLHLAALEAKRGGLFELFVRAPQICPKCEGTGWRKNMRACSKCEGGKIPGIGPWGIPVPEGVVDGQQLVCRGEGAKGRGIGAQPGDLWVTCRVPPVFQEQGVHELIVIPVIEPILVGGGKVRVPLPSGNAVRMTVPPGSNAGRKLRLKGKGSSGKDLYVRLEPMPRPTEVRATRVSLG